MEKFAYMEKYGYEQLVLFHDKNTGLKAITCIHNTVLGPSLGGTRFWGGYKNEDEAIEDALRLAKGMTYKSAMAGLSLGGGKSVVMGNPEELRKDSIKAEAFWRAFGRFVEGLNGRYITAQDVGTLPQDMVNIHKETKYVAGLPGRSGSPSPYTALGVYKAIKACCDHTYGSDSLSGKTIAVQGIGTVGYALCEFLHKEGANLIVSDAFEANNEKAVKDFKAKRVDLDKIYSVDCDIYAPCALGATINDETIPQLKCKIICGAANNVLKDAAVHGKTIHEKGFVYAPDYVANAGGVINVYYELAEGGYNEADSVRAIENIYDRISEVLRVSKETNSPTFEVADRMAEKRIDAILKTKSIYLRK